MNTQSFDFDVLRGDKRTHVSLGCFFRRFSASLFDVLFLALAFTLLSIILTEDAQGVTHIPAGVGLAVIAAYLFLPELLFRQTLGMYIFDIVVISPINRPAWQSLLIRRLINLVELGLPSAVYHFVTALSANFRSLGEEGRAKLTI